MTTVGEANVVVRPLVSDFRAEVAAGVDKSLGRVPISIPVTPKLSGTATALSWERIAGGAVVPVPITPTITPAGRAAFGNEVGGLRGLLLGGGQFAASRALGIGGAAAGLFLFGKAAIGAVKSAATLEQELNVFQQVSGATAAQMQQVREQARALGADIRLPAVSSADAAQTMTELAKAGLSVDDVLKGTKGTLELATAANIDFATSSELAANALNAFQLPGTDATKVADLLAGAANAAQGDISDFGIGLAQSAAVAHQAGISLSETVTFLTELAKAGIQGSDAGTSLRVALLRLIAPTNQARKIFHELGIELTDANGNVRTDVFEQLRVSMERVEPATRNAALATIFGTDAVRAAAIFVRDGAKGHEQLAQQVGRSGQAAETAAARTKGLAGQVGALSSNVQTLGTDLGTTTLPLLSGLVFGLNETVTAADKAVISIGDLKHRLKEGFDIPDPGGIGKHFLDASKAVGDFVRNVPGLKDARDSIVDVGKAAQNTAAVLGQTAAPGGSAVDQVLKGPRSGEDVRNAATAGNEIGTSFTQGVADGITTKTPAAVLAARRTVEDARRTLSEVVAQGQKAVADTIRQGSAAVQAAEIDAKQNLTAIGQQLTQQALQLLDSGPLAERIQRLQAKLNTSQTGVERTRLKSDLRDAQKALDQAEGAIAGGGGSAAQRAAEQDFLRPFREKVGDAKSALEEFNTQGTIDKLTARLSAQKAHLQKILDDVVARFNAGLLSAPEANREAAALLERNVGPMSRAGKKQGFAFRQSFEAELTGLSEQIIAIAVGPQTKKTGAEPRIVSPADAAAQAAADLRDARGQAARQAAQASRDLSDKVIALTKAQHADVAGPGGTNTLLKQIAAELAGPAHKPSSSVAPAPRPRRTGSR